MPDPREGLTGGSARDAGRNLALVLPLIFVLAAIALSTGLVVHTAWNHDMSNSPFAVLSARAALAWVSFSSQLPARVRGAEASGSSNTLNPFSKYSHYIPRLSFQPPQY